MRFYIMHRGLFEEIPFSEIRNHATVFAARDKRSLRKVKFCQGDCAVDTELSEVKKRCSEFSGELRIKVCGPAVFPGLPVGEEEIGGNNWGKKGDYYFKTEIIPGKSYCLSWIANYPGEDALCISFEILEQEK
ncbi:MAG: hypothetical protein PHZ04_03210 [Patescibacteria group bacterium]|nr:hypothetical protein [Patescibacteria group bacterium]MDD5554708.1 hypothetical protein [Patescibacteria group bacterium]